MSKALFRSWVGKNYGRNSMFGIPVMVLGESQYDWKDRDITQAAVTAALIKEEVFGEFEGKNRKFFANIVSAFCCIFQLRAELRWIPASQRSVCPDVARRRIAFLESSAKASARASCGVWI